MGLHGSRVIQVSGYGRTRCRPLWLAQNPSGTLAPRVAMQQVRPRELPLKAGSNRDRAVTPASAPQRHHLTHNVQRREKGATGALTVFPSQFSELGGVLPDDGD